MHKHSRSSPGVQPMRWRTRVPSAPPSNILTSPPSPLRTSERMPAIHASYPGSRETSMAPSQRPRPVAAKPHRLPALPTSSVRVHPLHQILDAHLFRASFKWCWGRKAQASMHTCTQVVQHRRTLSSKETDSKHLPRHLDAKAGDIMSIQERAKSRSLQHRVMCPPALARAGT